jgi:asparagine synthase (glutamine-hydrolysing)
MIGDNANTIRDKLKCVTFDPISVEDIRSNNLFITGPYTLFNEIRQVQAGEFITIDLNKLEVKKEFYFNHSKCEKFSKTTEELLLNFNAIFEKACNNLKLSLKGRTAIVPLTGGVDSREVLLMLHTINYKKVFCFTYGKKGNIEAKIAQELANYFGYNWIEIPYTRKLWRRMSKDPKFKNYLKWAGNLTSLPHVQDILAVDILIKNKMIPVDGVFIPGHTGTIVGGSLDEDFIYSNINNIADFKRIINKTFIHNKKTISKDLTKRIESYFDMENLTNEYSCSQHHEFKMKERQAKFIINSVRVFEYFNFEWLLPLCDLELLEFFKKLPNDLKFNKIFIRKFMNLDIAQSTNDTSFRRTIKSTLGRFYNYKYIRIVGKKIVFITLYFNYIIQSGGLYGFGKHIKEAIFENENVSTNTIFCKYYLSIIEDKRLNK